MRVSSQDSNSGVTGSEIHSPKRSWRVYAPGAGASQATSGGSAVIGRAWTIHSVPSASMAHSMSWGVPRLPAMRRASRATSAACDASIAASGRRRASALSPRTVHSSPSASPDTRRSAVPCTAVTTVVARSPLNGSAVNATPAAAGRIIRCTMTAIPASPVDA
jgi:hypothetical protein